MIRKTVMILAVAVVLFATGCGSDEDAAVRVADSFWKAMQDHDVEAAKQYVTAESASFLTMNDANNDEDATVTLGKPAVDGDKTTIETTIIAMQDDGSTMEIPMQTILLKENGDWKVDAQATMFSVFGGAMGAMMDQMGQAMQESLSESMDKMGKAMADGMQQTMQELDSSVSEE